MSYGLRVSNANGFIQIDETYSCYKVFQTGTFSIPNGWSTLNYTPIGSGRIPMIFFRINNNDSSVFYVESVTTSSIRFWGWGNNPTNVSIDWMLAAPSSDSAAGSDTHGLRIYSETGTLLYDSGSPVPKFTTILYPGNASSIGGSWQTRAVPVAPHGRKPFYMANAIVAVKALIQTGLSQMGFVYVLVRQPNNSQIDFITAVGTTAGGNSYYYMTSDLIVPVIEG